MMRELGRGFLKLVMVFGLWGVAVWPATGWYSYKLIHKELTGMQGLHVNSQALIGRDFINIWHGGQEALHHGAAGVYDRDIYRKTLFEKAGFAGLYAYSYPPHMLLLSLPFGMTGYLVALAAWLILTFGLFCHAARPWLRDLGLPGWAGLILPATIVNIWAGHFGFLIGALALYGWRRAENNPMRSGLAFAVMTVKPHMGILVPLVLAMKRQWKTAYWAAAGTGALVALSILVFGSWSWTTWLSSTLSFQAGLIEIVPTQPYSYMMPTSGRMLYALTRDPGLVMIGQIVIGFYAVATLIWAHKRSVPIRDLGLLSIVAIPLILPYSFNYDMVALCVVALVCAARFGVKWYSPDRAVYAAAFMIPLILVPLARLNLWPSPIILMLFLGCAAWRMVPGRNSI
ncbi:glycosyltransferase family 87 protein [Sphingobium boeckii]|uniref:DUF2029 domain-containing protein n=1 Tax=Sphingobium boeckii TaxID=1082345 RepID=A0A7W9EDY9_9SPHN|nr:glycosyltransferase family 87 protein [Sphingobium boeckii]MBB5684126.1 hypothetical protein [Sphingobium boeckii]